MIKMKDVAQRAGVSVATVSNVITEKKPVKEETRAAVLKAIEEMDYNVNFAARGLRAKKTYNIAVVLPEITRLFYFQVLHGIEDAAKEENYSITYFTSSTDEILKKRANNIFRSNWFDGIIMHSLGSLEERKRFAKAFGGNESKKTSIVTLGEIDRELYSYVDIDNEEMLYQATKHLISLGRKSFLFFAMDVNSMLFQKRISGYKRALNEARIDKYDIIDLSGGYTPMDGYLNMKETLIKQNHYDAILAAEDQTAIGIIAAIKEFGLIVPDDIAVIGFDNDFPSTFVTPALSSVNVQKYKMGYSSFKLLSQHMNDENMKPTCVKIEANLVIRESTDKNARSSWELFNWY